MTPEHVAACCCTANTLLGRIRRGELDPRPAAALLGLPFDQDIITGILEIVAIRADREASEGRRPKR